MLLSQTLSLFYFIFLYSSVGYKLSSVSSSLVPFPFPLLSRTTVNPSNSMSQPVSRPTQDCIEKACAFSPFIASPSTHFILSIFQRSQSHSYTYFPYLYTLIARTCLFHMQFATFFLISSFILQRNSESLLFASTNLFRLILLSHETHFKTK